MEYENKVASNANTHTKLYSTVLDVLSYFPSLLAETDPLTCFFSVFSLSSCVFCSEFPPIANEQERNDYKHEFDREHQEYKELQAELDALNKNLSQVDRELDDLQEGSPQYLVRPCYGWRGSVRFEADVDGYLKTVQRDDVTAARTWEL